MEASLGTRLRAQRERRGITLAAIADETKISIALLEGLERDDVSRWPGGLFRRAYLRSYARAIGLNQDVTLAEFMEVHPEPLEESEAATAVARAKANGGFLRSGIAALRRDAAPRSAVPRDPAPRQTAPRDIVLREAPPPAASDETIVPDPLVRDIPSLPPVLVAAPETTVASLSALARLCTTLGCAQDQQTVQQVLVDAGDVLDARGLVVWVWDAFRSALLPAIAHGYPKATLQQLAVLGRANDSAVAAAFRSCELRVVPGSLEEGGAVVAPLLTPDGCVGVLAIEFRNGGELRETTHAFAAILGAQISTLLPASVMLEAASA